MKGYISPKGVQAKPLTTNLTSAASATAEGIKSGIMAVPKTLLNVGKSISHGAANFLNNSGSLGNNTYKGTQSRRDFWHKSHKMNKSKKVVKQVKKAVKKSVKHKKMCKTSKKNGKNSKKV